jgi:hypothetical protein
LFSTIIARWWKVHNLAYPKPKPQIFYLLHLSTQLVGLSFFNLILPFNWSKKRLVACAKICLLYSSKNLFPLHPWFFSNPQLSIFLIRLGHEPFLFLWNCLLVLQL